MALSLSLGSLASRITRTAITSTGVRRVARSGLASSSSGGNIITQIWNAAVKFGGCLISEVASLLFSAISFSLTTIWSLCISAFQFVWNFNWNASDADLDASIQSAYNQLAGSLGGTLGNALGWLACGAVPGATIFAFNEPMGLYVLERVGEEALEEIAGNLADLIKQTAKSLTKALAIWTYKNIRNLWRQPDSVVKRQLIGSGIDPAKADAAIAKRNQPWSFAKATEDMIDSIPSEALKNFVEELFEEFGESCIEAGYVVAGSIDSYIAAQSIASASALGRERTVEITLNRSTDSTPAPTPTP